MFSREKLVVFAVIGGVAAAFLTGLIENTPTALVGAVWYGYPLAWLIRRVVAPQYSPWVVEPFQLILDIILWTLIIAVVIFAYSKIGTK